MATSMPTESCIRRVLSRSGSPASKDGSVRDDGADPSRWSLRRIAEVVTALVIGERPKQVRRGPRPRRAARAGLRRVRVDAGRVVWRSRIGVAGALPLVEIARVTLVEIEYFNARGPDRLVLYALAFGREGAVRLRVVAGGSPAAASAEGKRRLCEFWEATGVPVTRDRERMVLGRAKDYRRRWPEAFSFAHAYPLTTAVLVFFGWMLVVVPVLDRVLGT